MRFNDKSLQSLLDEIEHEPNTNIKCMVTHMNLDTANAVILPCGHAYDNKIFIPFFKITNKNLQYTSNCLYCGINFQNSDYVCRCCSINPNNAMCKKLTASSCGMCSVHTTHITRCKVILQNGKNKGNECGNKLKGFKNGLPCCGKHLK